jgi:tetratricopeptide (TPR) repeat protein
LLEFADLELALGLTQDAELAILRAIGIFRTHGDEFHLSRAYFSLSAEYSKREALEGPADRYAARTAQVAWLQETSLTAMMRRMSNDLARAEGERELRAGNSKLVLPELERLRDEATDPSERAYLAMTLGTARMFSATDAGEPRVRLGDRLAWNEALSALADALALSPSRQAFMAEVYVRIGELYRYRDEAVVQLALERLRKAVEGARYNSDYGRARSIAEDMIARVASRQSEDGGWEGSAVGDDLAYAHESVARYYVDWSGSVDQTAREWEARARHYAGTVEEFSMAACGE